MIAPMPSTMSENLMCSSERPTSVGSRLKAFCAAGVSRRMRRSRPTVTIGRSALLMKFDKSSVRASSSRLRLRNCSLTVVSSSFADCSSSFVVSSSSFVLCSSSLLDSTSSCAARSSWLAASCSSTIDCRYCFVDASSCRSHGGVAVGVARSPSSQASGRPPTRPASPSTRTAPAGSTRGWCATSDRQDAQRELDVVAAVRHVQALPHDRAVRRLGLGQGAAQLHEQALLRHAQNVGRRLAARRLEIRRGAAAELLDLEVVVHEHARRPIPAERRGDRPRAESRPAADGDARAAPTGCRPASRPP